MVRSAPAYFCTSRWKTTVTGSHPRLSGPPLLCPPSVTGRIPVPFSGYKAQYAAVTKRKHSGLGQLGWSQTYFQGPKRATMHSWPVSSSRERPDLRGKGLKESGTSSRVDVQPMYYDYYGGETGEWVYVGPEEGTSAPRNDLVFLCACFLLQ